MSRPKVTIYTSPTWVPCKQAKEFLSSHGVEFDAKDVATNPANLQEMMEVTGGVRGVPVIVIGTEVVRGFSREKVAGLLGLNS